MQTWGEKQTKQESPCVCPCVHVCVPVGPGRGRRFRSDLLCAFQRQAGGESPELCENPLWGESIQITFFYLVYSSSFAQSLTWCPADKSPSVNVCDRKCDCLYAHGRKTHRTHTHAHACTRMPTCTHVHARTPPFLESVNGRCHSRKTSRANFLNSQLPSTDLETLRQRLFRHRCVDFHSIRSPPP